mmetsp:Transcript_25068/g.34791  ORF Transcript_25068/g.34791 Transcript_25068/m.34791 type:complete len:92 (+) Transcript_25068:404-679(+)
MQNGTPKLTIKPICLQKKCFTASSFSVTGASGLHIGGASENVDEVNIKISMTTMTYREEERPMVKLGGREVLFDRCCVRVVHYESQSASRS